MRRSSVGHRRLRASTDLRTDSARLDVHACLGSRRCCRPSAAGARPARRVGADTGFRDRRRRPGARRPRGLPAHRRRANRQGRAPREHASSTSPTTRAWKAFPANPPIGGLNAYPWNYPSTDTRDIWCWTAGAGLRPRGLGRLTASRAFRGTRSRRDQDAEHSHVHHDGQQATTRRKRWGIALPAVTRAEPTGRPARPATTSTRGRTSGTRSTSATRRTSCAGNGNDIDAAIVNLFAMHNRHARLRRSTSASTRSTGTHRTVHKLRLASHGTRPGRRPSTGPVIGQRPGARDQRRLPNYGGRDNANMSTRADGVRLDHEHVPLAAARRRVLRPCVDGDYDMSVIGHEYGHMVENRMIGKGDRRRAITPARWASRSAT